MTINLLQAALYYAKNLNWQVFPCHSLTQNTNNPQVMTCTCGSNPCERAGKHPRYKVGLIENGLLSATTDPRKIATWWKEWPDANIGVACGIASGFIVLDVDPRNGGNESLAMLEEKYERLPATVESMTGGGGRHYLFASPGYAVKCGAEKLGSGLDIKADGGYIIVPPSLHKSGKRYEWEVSSKPTQIYVCAIPTWMTEMLETSPNNGFKRADEISANITSGQRNDMLTSLAGSMRRRGMSSEEIYTAISAVNAKRCSPPLQDDELKHISDSMLNYTPKEPIVPTKMEIRKNPPISAMDGILQFTDLLGKLEGRSIKTYITPLDKITGGLERQTLSILAARPGMGKTTLGWQIARNVASSGLRVYFFSLEMSITSLWAKAICGAVGVRWRDIRSQQASEDDMTKVIEQASQLLDAYGDSLLLDDNINTTQTIWDCVEEEKPDLVIVDHLRLVSDINDNEVQRLGFVSKRLKDMAKEFNCHVMALAQLNRGVEQRDDKRPQLSDLRESGHIEENADGVFMLYRDDYYETPQNMPPLSTTEFLVRKFRDDIGCQKAMLNFDLAHQFFGAAHELTIDKVGWLPYKDE